MNTPRCILPLIPIALSFLCAIAAAQVRRPETKLIKTPAASVPPLLAASFNFDTPQFKPGDVDGQLGWWVDQGSAEVIPGIGLKNSAALRILPDAPFTQARLSILRPRTARKHEPSAFYLDASVRLPAAPWLTYDETFDLDSARIGLFRSSLHSGDAEWHVFHGDGAGGGFWVNTGAYALVDPFTDMSFNWVRLTVREDMKAGRWSLWVDGVLLASNVGFQFPLELERSHFFVLGDSTRPVDLDNVSVSSINPLGSEAERNIGLNSVSPLPVPEKHAQRLDSDADGLPDAWELANRYDPADSADATADRDNDGLNTLDEYLLGTNDTVKTPRRQIASDTATVFNRSARNSMRRAILGQ